MIFKEITDDFSVKIVENKLNNNFFKNLLNNKEKLFNELTLESIALKIKYYPDKIKQVNNAKYEGSNVYEYRIILNKSNHVRMAFAINYEKKEIYILALMFLNSKLRKNVFDHAVSTIYHE